MSEHPSQWLEAYLDGELPAHNCEQIAAHLSGCPTCASELKSLRRLSSLLNEVPAFQLERPALVLPVERQARISPAPHTAPRQPAARNAWLAFPLVLVTVWAAIQVLATFAGLLRFDQTWTLSQLAPAWSGVLQQALSFLLLPAPITWLRSMFDLLPVVINWQVLAVQLVSSVACAVLLFGWLAGWFTIIRRSQPVRG